MREGEKQVRKHIWLFERDCEDIKALFGNTVGESKAIRLMVRKSMDALRAKAGVGAKSPIVDVDQVIGDLDDRDATVTD